MNDLRRKLSVELGFYKSSFFFIGMNTFRDLEKVFGSNKEYILTHEYIHFLQDISTTFALSNISHTIAVINNFIDEAKESDEKEISVPLVIRNANVRINDDMFRVYFGKNLSYNISLTNLKIIKYVKKEYIQPDINKKIEYYSIKFNNLDGDIFDYSLGAVDILEGMAYIIEDHIHPSEDVNPPLPYSTVQLLVEKIVPNLASNKYIISTICELALQTYNPGTMFVDILEIISNDNLEVKNTQDILSIMDGFSFSGPSYPSGTTWRKIYKESSERALENLKGFYGYNSTSKVRDWIERAFQIVENKKNGKVNFISEIIKSSKESAPVQGLMVEFGTPIIINNRQKGFAIDNGNVSDQLSYMRSAFELYDIMTSKKKFIRGCSMRVFCKQLIKEKMVNYSVDENCYHRPWERNNNESLCPFEATFAFNELAGYKFVLRKN
ncbi:hypothetical protein [Leptospira neocaledonica]|uniref:Uncharacterized protein n=1 Tax=Leptospira neocaledonica TaxID=2023192 RepID=A0A2M9ZTR8_9LEPT|nr:hypothetical protein [Leptospira neocaledonica]PJZ75293.1 hypothetical protein CH365_19630 [Leptospira neocaledonica]